MLNGLAKIHIETTSRCDKNCKFCGHQDPSINKTLEYGDMDFVLLESIRKQLPRGLAVAFHRDGEPLVYPRLGDALALFTGMIRSITTNGKKLVEKHDQIIDNCEMLCVSAFRGDPDGPEQLDVLAQFLSIKGRFRPQVLVKMVGDGDTSKYEKLGVRIIRRLIHDPSGNSHYAHHNPTVPEIGICLDFLHHPSVDWKGNLFICNRLDGADRGILGNLNDSTLDELWNGPLRRRWLAAHVVGHRDLSSPLCANCNFWGVPSEYRREISDSETTQAPDGLVQIH